jgi:hypothetical protein
MGGVMDAALKAKWVEALRSGKYEQAKGCLRDDDGFCCLGVLADVIAPEWTHEHFNPLSDEDNGLLEEAELLTKHGVNFAIREQKRLAELNDHGSTFAEIADYIEKNL